MTAEQMRDLVIQGIEKREYENYHSVICHIVDAAENNGKYFCFYPASITEETKKRLIENGYKVGQTQTDKDGEVTKISWEL